MLNSANDNYSAFSLQKKNPLERTGKIFKYTFMQYARVLTPLCIALMSLSLVFGLFSFIPGASIMDLEEKLTGLNIASIVVTSISPVLYFVVFIWALVIMDRNIKNSYFGDEAYLRMTLPVSIGEHMAGTMLSSILWLVITGIAACISLVLILLQPIVDSIQRGVDWLNIPAEDLIKAAVLCLVFAFMLIALSFLEHSLSSLVRKGKTAFRIGITIFIVILFEVFMIQFNIRSVRIEMERELSASISFFEPCLCFFASIGILSYAGSYLILKKKYNLE